MERRPRARGTERGLVYGQFRLPIEAESVACARQFVRATFAAWSLPAADDAELLVSEIVTNVVNHIGESDDLMRVTVLNRQDRIRIEVQDPSRSAPWRGKPDLLDESGRGLFLVDTISAEWGWDALEGDGKVIWFEVIA
jgi:anti-sigma regulatory factor (Ser/Thr protein kinase)